jgi:mono/diheme cytochrome c family protein
MRERWARMLALVTGLMVVLLSIGFAAVQNSGSAVAPVTASSAGASSEPAADAAQHARGAAIYAAQHCARCHSLAGKGSPRSPLDGVGTTRSAEEIHDWIIGADAVADELSPRTLNTKKAYRSLPAEDLNALVEYVQHASAH